MNAAAQHINEKQMEKMLGSVQIPPQPTLLLDIQEEQNKLSPDIKKICSIISQDVALAAAVLKTVNSPLYGLSKKIDSVQRATMLLGVSNIMNLVRSALLRNMLSGDGVSLEHFWDTATDVANISVILANHFAISNPDEFYTLGLFHDCGIALLAQKFPDYKDTLKEGNALIGESFTHAEEQRYKTNHAVVGYYMARSWNLSEKMTRIVLRHHDNNNLFVKNEEDIGENQMMAILKLASHISHLHRRLSEDHEWDLIQNVVLEQLDLQTKEYEELQEDIIDTLNTL